MRFGVVFLIRLQIKETAEKMKAKTIFVASDDRHMLSEIKEAVKALEVRTDSSVKTWQICEKVPPLVWIWWTSGGPPPHPEGQVFATSPVHFCFVLLATFFGL